MTEYRFFHPMEVRYGDLDPQGHLNNAKYLTYFEQTRVAYLTELGLFSRGQSFTEIGVIIADIHIQFHAAVFWGTSIKVGVRTTKIGDKSLTVEQCLVDAESDKLYATGTVVLVAYDYSARETMAVPDSWREVISQFEGRG
jgi:acyl-CoA thioester hydrolase